MLIEILFRQITMFIKAHVAFIFGLQTFDRFAYNLSIKGSRAQKLRTFMNVGI